VDRTLIGPGVGYCYKEDAIAAANQALPAGQCYMLVKRLHVFPDLWKVVEPVAAIDERYPGEHHVVLMVTK
jgi:hypothetical protein